ncbi:methyltransferase domain-containing protein [Pseudomonas veronii]|uniref:class I SAM-dependent methyltransferase n=1 Tax=Pseudomonas veronii TaxID=76761 RepID=UPI0018E75241|nr:class I SAM-dependent methyltransferase [Pseudomonas veronii]MBJ2178074.1 methyltransferase domain-containing protein [Pseudomonas veronii]
MVQDAVLASLGYTLMPADIAAPFLEDGQLVNLMPQSSSTCLLRTTRQGIITTQIALRALPRRLLALDCNETSIKETRAQLSSAGVNDAQVRQCNLYDDALTEPGQYDFIYARMVFQHLSDPLSALRNIHRSLAIGGRLCICDIDDRWFGAAPPPPELQSFLARVARAQAARGGDRHVGSKLANYLEETGYSDIRCSMLLVSTSLIGATAFCDLVFGYKMEVIPQAELEQAQREMAAIKESIESPGGWAGIGVLFVSGEKQ